MGIEMLLLLVFAPIKTTVSFCVVTDNNRCVICVDLVKIRAVTIKIKMENDAFRILINGKNKDIKKDKDDKKNEGKKKRKSPLDLPKILSFIKSEKMIRSARILGVVGADDAAESSVWCALLLTFLSVAFPYANKSLFYPDFRSSRLDLNAKIGARINLLQALEMAYISR